MPRSHPPRRRTLRQALFEPCPSSPASEPSACGWGCAPARRTSCPFLGPVAGLDGYYNACGHFRMGILTSPLTGLLLAETIAGERAMSFPIERFLLSRFAPNARPDEGWNSPQAAPARA